MKPEPSITFKPVNDHVISALLKFLRRKSHRDRGKTTEFRGKTYTLENVGHGARRTIYAYFSVDDSVIRISDLWSKSAFTLSEKLNQGAIGGVHYVLSDEVDSRHATHYCNGWPSPRWAAAGMVARSTLIASVGESTDTWH